VIPLLFADLSDQEKERIREEIFFLMMHRRWDFLSARSQVYADWGLI